MIAKNQRVVWLLHVQKFGFLNLPEMDVSVFVIAGTVFLSSTDVHESLLWRLLLLLLLVMSLRFDLLVGITAAYATGLIFSYGSFLVESTR